MQYRDRLSEGAGGRISGTVLTDWDGSQNADIQQLTASPTAGTG